jgi:hypothetical protein
MLHMYFRYVVKLYSFTYLTYSHTFAWPFYLHLRHSTIGHHDRVTTDPKKYFELGLAYRRAKDSYM